MKIVKILSIMILVLALTFVSFACSNAKSPVSPATDDSSGILNNLPESSNADVHSRAMLAAYDAVIDPVAKTFTVTPIERSAQYHYPLTQLYPNVLQITGYGWTPSFWADIKLSHPFPGSGIDAFDPRIIAILPANEGVSCYYPIFNVLASNSMIAQPDGYTKLFDSISPSIPGNTNPFKAYFKEEPNRIWSSTDVTNEIQRWEMDFLDFGGPIQFSLVVDVSTSYPNPPQPGIDNASEPVQVVVEIGDGLTPTGGEATVTATFLDWQGPDEIKCKVEAPALFENSVQLFYSGPGPNPDEYVFTGTISNELLAPYGNYMALLAVWDINKGNHLFVETIVSIKIPFNLNNKTPGDLNVMPTCMATQGQYLYVISENNGFHIYNISDPLNPLWVNSIEFTGSPLVVTVLDGYAYVAGKSIYSLKIIDIDPPELATVVHEVNVDGVIRVLEIHDGFLYAANDDEINIINIESPESAFWVNKIGKPAGEYRDIESISAIDGYVLVTFEFVNDNLYILDVDPPESAEWFTSINCEAYYGANKVIAIDGYAYVIGGHYLYVVDIDPIASAHIVEHLSLSGALECLAIQDGYAYVSSYNYGVSVIDIDPIESMAVVAQFDSLDCIEQICTTDGYAYGITDLSSYEIIDIQTPESAHIVDTVYTTCNARDLFVSGNYAYLASGYNGLQIVDISNPESSFLVNTFLIGRCAIDVYVSDGYAYVATWDGIKIVDVDPVESAHVVGSPEPYDHYSALCISGNYIYATDRLRGYLNIFNINPPESTHLVHSVDLDAPYDGADSVFVSENYAYVIPEYRMLIIDISTPESAFLAKNFHTYPGNPQNVFVSDGYAYLASWGAGMQIIDIDPVESTRIVDSTDGINSMNDISYANNYAFVKDAYKYLHIISVLPPTHLELSHTFYENYLDADRIVVSDGYAYLVGNECGLRIIELW